MKANLNWRAFQNKIGSKGFQIAAFTITELLVVIAIVVLLTATQLSALTRFGTPVNFTQCMNNLRQTGQAAMLYKADNADCYPFGDRIIYPSGVTNANSWTMQLLRFMGGYSDHIQPLVYVCPSEQRTAADWPIQIHYQANRTLFQDNSDVDQPLRGSQVRRPAVYWMLIEKDPVSFCSVRPGGLAIVLQSWNVPPGYPGHWRHNGGMSSVAADGHVEWLRTPPYRPNQPQPPNFLALGDCANGQNPGSTWQSDKQRVKLYSRYSSTPPPGSF